MKKYKDENSNTVNQNGINLILSRFDTILESISSLKKEQNATHNHLNEHIKSSKYHNLLIEGNISRIEEKLEINTTNINTTWKSLDKFKREIKHLLKIKHSDGN